jgi:hypothetical protein
MHIIVNNTKYFDDAMFKEFCYQIGMKVAFASPPTVKWSS